MSDVDAPFHYDLERRSHPTFVGRNDLNLDVEGGDGKIALTRPCDHCKGRGRVSTGMHKPGYVDRRVTTECLHCNGNGRLCIGYRDRTEVVQEQVQVCSCRSQNTGRKIDPNCHRCKGRGVVVCYYEREKPGVPVPEPEPEKPAEPMFGGEFDFSLD